jgi:hypothetical protein
MLDSVPVPLQAILWPLAGAVFTLILSRLLPNWARRLLAMAAALASLAALWSLRGGAGERIEIIWTPLQFFRMSPVLYPDGLSLLVGIMLAGVTSAFVLSLPGCEPRKTVWHSLILVALAGCLAATMAANLLALALGSALIDLALVAVAVLAANDAQASRRMPLHLIVPGVASTLVLFLGALQMDAQLGHASFLSQSQSPGALVLVGVAGMLRALVFPLHPRGLRTPAIAASLLLSVGVGGYLLVRAQALAPALSAQPWAMIVATAGMLGGGFLAWSGRSGSSPRWDDAVVPGKFWSGALIHQTGYLLSFVLFLPGVTPWPLVSFVLALGVLVIWWDDISGTEETAGAESPAWPWQWMRQQGDKLQSYFEARLPRLERWRDTRFGRVGMRLVPAIALASLASAPLTAGARGRWYLYAAWLERSNSSLLFALAADAFLVAGLWIALGTFLTRARTHRPRASTLLASAALSIPIVVLGIAPGALGDGLGLQHQAPSDVSIWGLGLLYMAPWLLGAWLARMSGRLRDRLGLMYELVNLDWLYRAAGWAGQWLVGGIHWLGKVGEGEGWWGWVLIILAIGVILLTVG